MLDVLLRAASFIAIILLGYCLKKIGFFRQEDFAILSRITIRITLPASIICSFAGRTIETSLLVLVFLGMGCGLTYVFLGYILNCKRSKDQQAFEMLNLAGYNIGNFVLPFTQSFLGPVGVIATSLFDTGNAVVCLGGAYSLASTVKDGGGFSVKRIANSLIRSVPFMCYVIMLLLGFLHLNLPKVVLSTAQVIANANPFMAMLMIGVGFRLEGDRAQMGTIARMLAIRYGVGVIFALAFYYLLPFDVQIRQTLVILVLSPIGSAVPGFTQELKGDVGLSSALNSMAILISIVITVVLLSVML